MMGALVRGTIVSVDEDNQRVWAELVGGNVVVPATYTDQAPWPGTVASFQEVSPGKWIVFGTQGRREGLGPNILTGDGGFERPDDIDEWSDGQGSTVWRFDTGTDSWIIANGALTQELDIVFHGAGSLLATFVGVSDTIRSPIGASGVPVVVGDAFSASSWMLHHPDDGPLTVFPRIQWFTGAGAHISYSDGATITTSSEVWRDAVVTGTAPATAAFGALRLETSNHVSGERLIIDTAAFTGLTNTTITHETAAANVHTGTGAMRIRSAAAGITLAQWPLGETGEGAWPVRPGELWSFSLRYKQTNGLVMYLIANYYGADDVYQSTEWTTSESESEPGTSSFQFHTRDFEVPDDATNVRFGVAFLATGATQDLYVDEIAIRPRTIADGGAIGMLVESDTGGEADRILMTARAAGTGFPAFYVGKGHVLSRAIHVRIQRRTGNQNINNGFLTFVTFGTTIENSGFQTVTSTYVVIPRTGYYAVACQVTWAAYAIADLSIFELLLQRWASDGSAGIESVVAHSHFNNIGASESVSKACSNVVRCNKGERIYVIVGQNIGRTLQLVPGTVKYHSLAVTYVGEAI